jgi:hypothetical protein
MKIKRLKANVTEVSTSNGITTLFFGSMAIAARMKDGRYIAPESDQLQSLKLNSHFTATAKDDAVNWWVARNVRYKQEIQTIRAKVFNTLIEGI